MNKSIKSTNIQIFFITFFFAVVAILETKEIHYFSLLRIKDNFYMLGLVFSLCYLLNLALILAQLHLKFGLIADTFVEYIRKSLLWFGTVFLLLAFFITLTSLSLNLYFGIGEYIETYNYTFPSDTFAILAGFLIGFIINVINISVKLYLQLRRRVTPR